MSRYELYLFIHIAAAIIWLGGGLFSFILGARANRMDDHVRMKGIVDDLAALAKLIFIPAGLIVVAMGVLMVVDGPWSFGELWIVLGLLGYLATFITGVAVFEPTVRKISSEVEREGGFGAGALRETRRLLILGRIDTLVLFMVVAVMTVKPTGDDVGVLVALAVLLALGAFHVVTKLREIDRGGSPAPVPAGA